MSLNGKIKHIPLWSRAVGAWTNTTGGTLQDTLESLPAKVYGSNIRNYLIGLVINYQGTILDSAAVPPAILARTIHNSLGELRYKDAWGEMLPWCFVDHLTASNFSEGIQSRSKYLTAMGIPVPVQNTAYTINHSVVLAYAPKAFACKQHKATKLNGVMDCALLGQDAEIHFRAVGDNISATCVWEAAPIITLTAVVWQSKELIVPAPTQIRSDILNITAGSDPYIEEGEPRKLEDMLVLYRTNATVSAFWTSATELQIDFDGNEFANGRCWAFEDATHLQRNHWYGFRGVNDPDNAAAAAGIFWDTDFYQGNAATLLDADGFEESTQGRAVRRLEIRNHATIETRAYHFLIQRRRFECSQTLFEKWCERQGIPVDQRADLRAGLGSVANEHLSRGEAIGVQMKIGSRKERR